MNSLADLIREQEWDEERARWRRKMRRTWVACWIVSFVVSTASYVVILATVR